MHHKKEVRSRTDLGETWGRIGYASWTIVWMDLADRRLLPPRTARAHPSSPAGLPQGGEGKPQRRPADRGADTESWVNRQGGGHCKSAADDMSIKSKGWWKESRMGWGSGGERRKRRRAIRLVFVQMSKGKGSVSPMECIGHFQSSSLRVFAGSCRCAGASDQRRHGLDAMPVVKCGCNCVSVQRDGI